MFDDLSAIDVSGTVGLVAMVLFTVNLLMGMLVSVNYNTVKQWPHRKLPIPLYKVHNANAYAALAVATLHPLILLFSKTAHFRFIDILWPPGSPGEVPLNVLGGVTFWCFAVVVVTSYLRRRLGHVAWKRIHYAAYAAALTMFLHGVLTDQNLKNQPPDLLDGEKVLGEVCALLVVAGGIWRWRYGSEKKRWRAKQLQPHQTSPGAR